MAFGFGFNKQKVLSSAEKFVQQGKLQNAITEYEKIRKHDDKDLTVANTIGDLYARQGDTGKAIECFKSVGDAYAAQGFTVKGIAMYKKITKLQPSMDASLKLAELYTQQGLFNDARAQYLQVAEDFLKSGDLEQAVRLFQKVLEMDPENVPMRVKLAEVYIKLGRKKEAWEIFSAAAESLRSRGSLAAAEDILQRMLFLDPRNSYVLLLRGRAALESGDPKAAIQYLEKASDIDSHADGLRDLLKAYLASGNLPESGPIAEKLLSVHNDPEGLFLLGEGAARLGHSDKALEVYSKHAGRLLTTDSAKLLAKLHALIAHVQGDAGSLEKLLKLLKKSGESTHVNEVAELLAHACVKNGNLEARARSVSDAGDERAGEPPARAELPADYGAVARHTRRCHWHYRGRGGLGPRGTGGDGAGSRPAVPRPDRNCSTRSGDGCRPVSVLQFAGQGAGAPSGGFAESAKRRAFEPAAGRAPRAFSPSCGGGGLLPDTRKSLPRGWLYRRRCPLWRIGRPLRAKRWHSAPPRRT